MEESKQTDTHADRVQEHIEQAKTAIRQGEAPRADRSISEAMQLDLDRRFTYHTPKNDQPARYTSLRAKGKELAEEIVRLSPYSREQSLALTKLEEALFFANAAIARNE